MISVSRLRSRLSRDVELLVLLCENHRRRRPTADHVQIRERISCTIDRGHVVDSGSLQSSLPIVTRRTFRLRRCVPSCQHHFQGSFVRIDASSSLYPLRVTSRSHERTKNQILTEVLSRTHLPERTVVSPVIHFRRVDPAEFFHHLLLTFAL